MQRSHHRYRAVIAGAAGLAVAAAAGVLATTAHAAAGCRVNYTVSSSWPGGFGANVTITNLGDPVSSWRLSWSFAAGQSITQLWNGTHAQAGAQVTVSNAAYNGSIATNATASFGFNGSWTGSNPVPTAFTLNGTACTGAVGESPSPTTPTSSPSPTVSPSVSPTVSPTTSPGGSDGPYPAGYETSGGLPNHTIYRPDSLPSYRMPIVVWGQGGCSANGTSVLPFLRYIASYGFLVLANGSPNGSGTTTSAMLTQSMDWAVAENARQGGKYYGRLDTSKIAAAGFSCGGLEAYDVSTDPRVTTTGIFSSGYLNASDRAKLRLLTKPIAYIIGGPSDIAYSNAMADWAQLPAGLPAFMGNLNVGHGGTYTQPDGGEFGRVAALYFRWRLKGDQTAGRYFVGANCGLCNTQWSVQQKNLTL
ncbi:cellulose-binding domain-containing protein [Phytohabitans houttuyneae]|uniref:CBM2 domain-containing protein n=1 Tax=Phytohabitans houttuyneae TaxID=1076126 RepID=A0A6V8KK98_9ACTN|nr:cellulose-binding domain-containing protein [Phytohabitans houttuyneae]GFJ81115.1 hypothetical protein Phou_052950 [Phytohabitans houttuyneae]